MPHGKTKIMTTSQQAAPDADMMTAITANITDVRTRIATARASGDADIPALVAVSKRQPDDRIEAALASGHRLFGENRVQEAQQRWQHRRESYPDLTLHLIGPLQTNKAAEAVALFDVIEVVDGQNWRVSLGRKWTSRAGTFPVMCR